MGACAVVYQSQKGMLADNAKHSQIRQNSSNKRGAQILSSKRNKNRLNISGQKNKPSPNIFNQGSS